MEEKELKKPIDKEYQAFLKKLSGGLIAGFVLIALIILIRGIGFFEDSAAYFMSAFIVGLVGFHFALIHEKVFLIALIVIFNITMLTFISNSISWRKDYVDQGFILEAYVNEYPTYLESLIGWFGFGPYVTGFAEDCLGEIGKPVRDSDVPDSCSGIQKVQQEYGVDVKQMIIDYHTKMKRTAKFIADGRASVIGYPGCVNTKRCAFVPLPPADMSEREIENSTTPEIVIVRDGFWDLVERQEITPRICANMFLCNRLVHYGILKSFDFRNIQKMQNPNFDKDEDAETRGPRSLIRQ